MPSLQAMTLRSVETPQGHVRTALQLLDELEGQLRLLGVGMPTGADQVGLLAAARRRLWLAVAALESRRDRSRWWVRHTPLVQKRGWAVMIALEVIAWSGLAIGFALSCVWRYTRAALRMLWRI